MKFSEFKMAVSNWFSGRCQWIQRSVDQKRLEVREGALTFPTQCSVTEFDQHFVAEMFGQSPRFRSIKYFDRHMPIGRSANDYFQQFDGLSGAVTGFAEGSRATSVVGVTMSSTIDVKQQLSRLGLNRLRDLPKGLYHAGSNSVGALKLAPTNFSLFLINSLLLNAKPPAFRGKWINFAVVASKDLSNSDFMSDLQFVGLRNTNSNLSPFEAALFRPNSTTQELRLRTQFSSLFLTGAIRETAIGSFLSQNPEVLSRAIGGHDFLHEKEFRWQVGDQPSIKPDFLLQRPDGFWNICDLKTALLLERQLTTGGPSRIRFKDAIHEGIAQLVNYQKYFEVPENAAYAQARYGVTFRDPQLILIVGNRENMPEDLVEAACQNHPANITILDYDTIAALYDQTIA